MSGNTYLSSKHNRDMGCLDIQCRRTEPSEHAAYHEASLEARTWRVGPDGVVHGQETVGVFVLWTGAMADLPMRCKMYKNPQWSALHACDACGVVGVKHGAVKFLGCVVVAPGHRSARCLSQPLRSPTPRPTSSIHHACA